MEVLLNDIKVKEGRQRKDLGDLSELKTSIRNLGLLNPLVVEQDNVGYILVAGERRLTALREIAEEDGVETPVVKVSLFDSLDEKTKQLIELDENIKRKDLHWKELVKAYARIVDLFPDETIDSLSKKVGISPSWFSQALAINEYLEDDRVKNAVNISNAYTIVRRINDRKLASVKLDVNEMLDDIFDEEKKDVSGSRENAGNDDAKNAPQTGANASMASSDKTKTEVEQSKTLRLDSTSAHPEFNIIQADFLEWAENYKGEPFNLIHCDFPYGIDHQRSGQGRTATFGTYEDTPDIYEKLIKGLLTNRDKLIAPSAHVVCWLSLKYAEWTIKEFEKAGFTHLVQPFIWHKSDGKGIVADPQCGMRNIGEYAFIFIRDRRKVCKIISNIFPHPATKHFHASEKPVPVLQKLFSALVDDTSRVLDPTCGSGTAIQAAYSQGAKYALGIELDAGFATEASKWLDEFIREEQALKDIEIDL